MSNDQPPIGSETSASQPPITKARRMARQPKIADIGASELAKSKSAPATSPRVTKLAIVLEMLGRPEGATLEELMTATGWLAHSARAFLTGLRKKGHAIELIKGDDRKFYRITQAAE